MKRMLISAGVLVGIYGVMKPHDSLDSSQLEAVSKGIVHIKEYSGQNRVCRLNQMIEASGRADYDVSSSTPDC